MVKVIIGKKGSGKTKRLIDMVNAAAKDSAGSVVCIEKGLKLTYDINYQVRLIDVSDYDIQSYTELKGFVAGIMARDYDVSEIFIDSIIKMAGNDLEELAQFLDDMDKATQKHNCTLTVTVSAGQDEVPESVKKHII